MSDRDLDVLVGDDTGEAFGDSVQLDGRGGVRIEDTLVVGPDGAEPLTRTTRDLLVLD